MKVLINLLAIGLFAYCSPLQEKQGQKKSDERPQPQSAVQYGDPKPNPDDPKNPWTVDKLASVEAEIVAGEKRQIATFEIPKSAKEAIIKGEVSNSIRNVSLFVMPEEEAEKLQHDRKYSPERVKDLGRALGFHFSVQPGTKYTVWSWNKDAEGTNLIKLKLERHYR